VTSGRCCRGWPGRSSSCEPSIEQARARSAAPNDAIVEATQQSISTLNGGKRRN
jgi:hypothetical protein